MPRRSPNEARRKPKGNPRHARDRLREAMQRCKNRLSACWVAHSPAKTGVNAVLRLAMAATTNQFDLANASPPLFFVGRGDARVPDGKARNGTPRQHAKERRQGKTPKKGSKEMERREAPGVCETLKTEPARLRRHAPSGGFATPVREARAPYRQVCETGRPGAAPPGAPPAGIKPGPGSRA